MGKKEDRQKKKDSIPRIQFPEIFSEVFKPHRYKVMYGGRGGMKSQSAATALLIMGKGKQLRILCARELQKSIRDSVHRLLSDLIMKYEMLDFYEIQQSVIKGKNGTEFLFEGLKHNASQIKSYEGVDICWVEEAQSVSKSSWEYLIPTIRKEGSEIWLTFNPLLEEDETYQRFVIDPPKDAWVIKSNYNDNMWLTNVLRGEMEYCRTRNYNEYLCIWEGQCRPAVEGAVYAEELRIAGEAGRLTAVPYDKMGSPICTFWDLGFGDYTSIWFMQKHGFEYHVIDFYQNRLRDIDFYAKILKEKDYNYGTCYLPWDGATTRLGSKSIENLLQVKGFKTDIADRMSVADGIHAVRALFPQLYFDKNKCADGLQALRRYHYADDPDSNKTSKEPVHDDFSHAADALRTFATVTNILWESFVYNQFDNSRNHGNVAVLHDWNPLREMEAVA